MRRLAGVILASPPAYAPRSCASARQNGLRRRASLARGGSHETILQAGRMSAMGGKRTLRCRRFMRMLPPMMRAISVLLLATASCAETRYTQDGMCGGPQAGWLTRSAGIGELALFQPIRIAADGRIRWNGTTVTKENLGEYLVRLREMRPMPQLALVVETGADCRTVEEVGAQMEAALGCAGSGRCGEGAGWRRYPGASIED